MRGVRAAGLVVMLVAAAGCRRTQAPPKTTSRWVYPLPQGNHLHGIWVAKSGDVFAVGEGGTLVHFGAADQRWTTAEIGDATLTVVWGDDAGRLVAGGVDGTLLLSRDGGGSWAPVASGTGACIRALAGCGAEIYAVGTDGQFTRSSDGGAHWHAGRVPGAPPPRKTGWPLDAAGDLTGVVCEGDGRVTAIAYGGAVLTSRDHGATWKRRTIAASELRTVMRPERRDGLAFVRLVRAGPDLLILSEAGFPGRGERLPTQRWTHVLRVRGDGVEPWPVSLPLSNEVDDTLESAPFGARSLAVTASGRAAIVGEAGNVYWTARGDRIWHETVRDLTPHEIGVQEMGMDDVAGDDRALYAAGDWGSVLRSTDAGQHWKNLRSRVDHFQVLWAEGEEAMVTGAGLSQSHDGGRTWSEPRRIPSLKMFAPIAIWGAGAERYFATPEGLLRSSDGGAHFTIVPIALGQEGELRATGVWGNRAGALVVVGGVHEHHGPLYSGVILRRTASGFDVAVRIPPPPLVAGGPRAFTCLDGNDAGRVYAGGVGGLAYGSADAGATWTLLPKFAGDQDWKSVRAGRGTVVWALTEIPARSHETRLWQSVDAGQHFAPVTAPRGPRTISAIGGSPAGELVAAAEGRVFEYDETTLAWTELTVGAHAASVQLVALAAPARRHILATGDFGAMLRIAPRDEP